VVDSRLRHTGSLFFDTGPSHWNCGDVGDYFEAFRFQFAPFALQDMATSARAASASDANDASISISISIASVSL
jgi:hypothetical protein